MTVLFAHTEFIWDYFSERKIFINWSLIYSVFVTVWEKHKNIKLLSIICQSYHTWDAQAFSLQTSPTHTTENTNWDIIEEKETLKKDPSKTKHVKAFTFSSRPEVLSISSPLIEKNSVTIIP